MVLHVFYFQTSSANNSSGTEAQTAAGGVQVPVGTVQAPEHSATTQNDALGDILLSDFDQLEAVPLAEARAMFDAIDDSVSNQQITPHENIAQHTALLTPSRARRSLSKEFSFHPVDEDLSEALPTDFLQDFELPQDSLLVSCSVQGHYPRLGSSFLGSVGLLFPRRCILFFHSQLLLSRVNSRISLSKSFVSRIFTKN